MTIRQYCQAWQVPLQGAVLSGLIKLMLSRGWNWTDPVTGLVIDYLKSHGYGIRTYRYARRS